MALTYYEKLKYRRLPLVRGLVVLNVAIGLVVLAAWQAAVLVVLDPLSWAASSEITKDRSWTALLTYPMAMFWITPSVAVLIGWMAMKSRRFAFGAAVMLAPVLIAVLTLSLYWILPSDVR